MEENNKRISQLEEKYNRVSEERDKALEEASNIKEDYDVAVKERNQIKEVYERNLFISTLTIHRLKAQIKENCATSSPREEETYKSQKSFETRRLKKEIQEDRRQNMVAKNHRTDKEKARDG